jgi:hypothetical protein
MVILSHICFNCSNIVNNLYKKYLIVREKCYTYIRRLSTGSLTPSKLPQQIIGKPIAVTPKSVKRQFESPRKLPTPTLNKELLREQRMSPMRQPLEKKPKRCLFEHGIKRYFFISIAKILHY